LDQRVEYGQSIYMRLKKNPLFDRKDFYYTLTNYLILLYRCYKVPSFRLTYQFYRTRIGTSIQRHFPFLPIYQKRVKRFYHCLLLKICQLLVSRIYQENWKIIKVLGLA
jgi:hypothetical protein